MNTPVLQKFLTRNSLGEDYLDQVRQWFDPLLCSLLKCSRQTKDNAIIVGISGCQGSGKSTLADYLCTALVHMHGISAVAISLDDFYLLKSERQALAKTTHPLLATRGVPGTHDFMLAIQLLKQLKYAKSGEVELPVFDKGLDDRNNELRKCIELPVKIILFEGWCLGVEPQTPEKLIEPINSLERELDKDGTWRSYVNKALADYADLFKLLDYSVMLKAPSFQEVLHWRIEQERKMITLCKDEKKRKFMSDAEVHQFIQYYQRLTEHCLHSMPEKVHHLFELSNNRRIINYTKPLATK